MKTITAIVTLVVCAGASAHHSYAEFDMSKTAMIKGTVAKVEWSNPHAYVWIYVPTGQSGQGGHHLYGFENGSAAMLRRFGWTKDTLPVGAKITVQYRPLKDGRHGGYFIQATHADGRVTTGDPYAPGGAKIHEVIRLAPALEGAIK